jgi:hypothetical protein
VGGAVDVHPAAGAGGVGDVTVDGEAVEGDGGVEGVDGGAAGQEGGEAEEDGAQRWGLVDAKGGGRMRGWTDVGNLSWRGRRLLTCDS